MNRTSLGTMAVIAVTSAGPAHAAHPVKLDGYVEGREGGELIIDGQRVQFDSRVKLKGHGPGFAAIPLGYEAKVKGVRQPDGSVLAQEIQAKPNGRALFEEDLRQSFDALEDDFRRAGVMFEEGEYGIRHRIGSLWEAGPEVARARSVLETLVPSYIDTNAFRVYVIDNPEWNAVAAPNGAIFVFTSERALARYLADNHEHALAQVSTYEEIQVAAVDGSLEVEVTDENVYVLPGLADDLAAGPESVDADQLDLAVELFTDAADFADDDSVETALASSDPLGWYVSFVLNPDPTRMAPSAPFDAEAEAWRTLEREFEARLRKV